MSLVKSKAIQLGFDATPTNNFLIYQPLTPDGTFRIANGNQGATTDIMTVTSGGSVTFAGTTNFSSLNFGAGSESSPSLFPTGDSNTGIWFPAADTFAVSTGGTQRLKITSGGQVGIGMTNPPYSLSVGGTTQAILSAYTTVAPGGSGFAAVRLGSDNGTDKWQLQYDAATSTFNIYDFTNSVTRLTIKNDGNIGVGTTNPNTKISAWGAAAVSGDGRFTIESTDTTAYGAGVGGGIAFGGKYNAAGNTAWFGSIKGIKENANDGDAKGVLSFAPALNGNPTERARITSDGQFIVGTTGGINSGKVHSYAVSGYQAYTAQVANNNYSLFQGFNSSGTVAAQMTGAGAAYFSSALQVGMSGASAASEALTIKRTDATVGAQQYTLGWFQNNTGYQNGLAIKSGDNIVTLAADFAGQTTGAAHLAFAVNNTTTPLAAAEKMRLETSGKLCVGMTSSYSQTSTGSISIPNGASLGVSGFGRLWNPGQQIGNMSYAGLYGAALTYMAYYSGGWKSLGGGVCGAITIDEGRFAFSSSNSVSAADTPITWTNRFTCDPSGNFALYTIGGSNPQFLQEGASDPRTFIGASLTVPGSIVGDGRLNVQDRSGICVSFYVGTTKTGSVTVSGSNTSYNTSSDYRLKQNVKPMLGALEVISKLNPVTFNWIADGLPGQGFIAHELQEVFPDAVTGDKDAVEIVEIKDEDGNVTSTEERPVYQGIDTSFLIATLTKAIQEQQEIINDLKARLDAAGL